MLPALSTLNILENSAVLCLQKMLLARAKQSRSHCCRFSAGGGGGQGGPTNHGRVHVWLKFLISILVIVFVHVDFVDKKFGR